MSPPRRVLVTGAAGFIGSHVTRVLLNAGCEVGIVTRPENPLARLHDVVDHLNIIPCDLSDPLTLRPALALWRPDCCIHLAWFVEPGKYLTAPENVSALFASLGLLDELIRAGCGHVVMTGTCAEYDTYAGFLREDDPTQPRSLYAATKLSLGLMAAEIAGLAGITLGWARIFYVYGPYEDQRRVVPSLIRSLRFGDEFLATVGDQVRDYLHVADVATALCSLAMQRTSGVVNVCSGIPVTMRQVMETIGEIVGSGHLIHFGALPGRAWDPPFICGDNRRLRDATGWEPRYASLKEGLVQTADWWEAR